jgi:hypothetical protein
MQCHMSARTMTPAQSANAGEVGRRDVCPEGEYCFLFNGTHQCSPCGGREQPCCVDFSQQGGIERAHPPSSPTRCGACICCGTTLHPLNIEQVFDTCADGTYT